ncbi:MAG TPA: CPBP family glutamic-type intramembrane protease [Vicinamibacteria bacterium]|nr:CPBP family glutamic-type intramembrane protease [Vicinamibacteria bacterium]
MKVAIAGGTGSWVAAHRQAFAPAVVLAALAIVVPAALGMAVANVWYRMAAGGLLLSATALVFVHVDWRALFRPTWRHVAHGAAAAAFLYVTGALVARMLAASPALAAQMSELYEWKRAVPGALAVPLLLLIVLGEEIVWRNAVTLPLAARLGPWPGVLSAAALFALAHLPLGVPLLLLAALSAGTFWSALVLKTRSAVPALVSHLLFDLAVLFWLPYVRA